MFTINKNGILISNSYCILQRIIHEARKSRKRDIHLFGQSQRPLAGPHHRPLVRSLCGRRLPARDVHRAYPPGGQHRSIHPQGGFLGLSDPALSGRKRSLSGVGTRFDVLRSTYQGLHNDGVPAPASQRNRHPHYPRAACTREPLGVGWVRRVVRSRRTQTPLNAP